MSNLPDPINPVLEPAAKELCEQTDPQQRIYEVPPEQQILRDTPKPMSKYRSIWES